LFYFSDRPLLVKETHNTTSAFITGKVLIEKQCITLKHAIILKIISIKVCFAFGTLVDLQYMSIHESWDQKVNITASKSSCLLPT